LSTSSAFLTCAWKQLVALSWEVDPRALAHLVPENLELDRHEGRTLVSLVGFLFLDTRVLGLPLPFQQRFEEVNLRFYVRRQAAEGVRHGVVFLKELVPRWAIAAGARWLFGEPYRTMPMRHHADLVDGQPIPGGRLSYEWKARGQWNRLSATAGASLGAATAGSIQEFVIERYWGYTRRRSGGTSEYRVEHPRWRLWTAEDAGVELADAAHLHGPGIGAALAGPPCSALIADGSAVSVSWGSRVG
jgi:uncharacterized protein YqjF (DUF2071 family)